MKNFKIVIILLTFSIIKVNAQQSKYIQDKNLDKFTGTWVGEKDGKSVKIVFEKKVLHVNKTPGKILDIDSIIGSLDYSFNGKLVVSYSGDELIGGTGIGHKDTLTIFIDVKSRKTQVSLLAIYQKDGNIKLEVEKKRFEFKGDKKFELKDSIILRKED